MTSDRQTKNILTKDIIAEELLQEKDKSTPLFTVLSVIYPLVVGVVFLGIYLLGLKNVDVGVIGYAIYFILMLLCLSPTVVFIMCVSASVTGRQKIKNRDFTVTTADVIYKEEKTVRRRNTTYTKKIVHFGRFGDVEVSSTLYQITSADDLFYVVTSGNGSTVPKKIYPAKLYEYKE